MLTQPLPQPLNQRSIGQRKKKLSNNMVSQSRRISPQQTGIFLPAVSNDKSLDYSKPFVQSPNRAVQHGQNTFKAIRLTKHDLEIQPQTLTITSPQDAISNMRAHHTSKKGNLGIGNRTSSLDSGEQFLKHVSVSHASKKDIVSAKSKDGFSLASKSNSVSPLHQQVRREVLKKPSDQWQHQSPGFVARNTSTVLPQTAKVFIQQHHSSNRADLIKSRDSSQERKKIDLSSCHSIEQKNGDEPDKISFDQESNNEEQQQLQSMFDPVVQTMLSIDQGAINTHNGLNLPKLRTRRINDSSNVAIVSGLSGSVGGRNELKANAEMYMTKNSLFSKQSQSVVTEEEVAQHDVMLAQSAQKVRDLFKPRQFATEKRSDKRIHFRRTRQAVPKSIFLRRTSSALYTKYSRKFKTNQQVKAAMTKPSKEMFHNASFQMPPTISPLSPHQNLQTQRNNPNQDSIYTIGEVCDNSRGILGYNRHNIPSGLSGSAGSVGSRSRSNSNQKYSSLARPSYREPTVAAEGKVTMGEGMVHRKSMTRAIEAMRLASLKQSRLQNQNVNRVCEDLMLVEKVKNDKELEQFGRNYLKKLYSMDREFSTTGNSPKSQMKRNEKQLNMTMQSFGIGSQHLSMDSNYRGRLGTKGFSLQPTSSLVGQLACNTGPVAGYATPFRSSKQHLGGGSIVLQNQRMSLDKAQSSQNKPFESYDEDQLMQEIIEEHLDPSKGQIVVTLDGELGQSFIQYLASEEASKTLIIGKDMLESSISSYGNLLAEGITGKQKPILPSKLSRLQYVRDDPRTHKRVGFTTIHSPTKKLIPIKLIQAPPAFLGDQTTSSPPETAEDNDQDSLNGTMRAQDLRYMLSSGQSSKRGGGIKVEGAPGQLEIPYRQIITQAVPVAQTKNYDSQSIISHDSAKIDKSRLNTGNITTYAGGQNLQSDIDRAETEENPQRKGKRIARKTFHQQEHSAKVQVVKAAGMFERKGLEQAMNQHVDVLYQSFGGDSTKKPPYRKMDFHDGESRTQTGKQPNDRNKAETGSYLRESFERKIVPLGAKHIEIGSINSSREDDGTPLIDIGSSSGERQKTQFDVSTVGGGSVPHETGTEDGGRGEHTSMGQIIHSPQIISKGRKAITLRNETPTPPPIDITMTNYAIDKVYLERSGSPRFAETNSPPDTQNPEIRGKGTKVLLQQAQMDPNSFLHTQPIHFDNFHVQARPLAKTIYGKQYKLAQEKHKQAKRKMQLIADEKATAKLMAGLAEELRPMATAAAQAEREAAIKQEWIETQQSLEFMQQLQQKQVTIDEQDTPTQVHVSQPSQMNLSQTPMTSNPHTATIRSQPPDANSVLAKYSKPYDIVDLQIHSEKGSTIVGESKRQSQDVVDSRIIINLNEKDFSRTIGPDDLGKSMPTTHRLGTGGTLNHAVAHEFTGRCSPQLSDKETVMRLPQVGKAIIENQEVDNKSRIAAARGLLNNTIITEVSYNKRITNNLSKFKQGKSLSARKAQKAQKMTVVQNVHMDELLRNGQFIQEPIVMNQPQLPSLTVSNPLQTERVFAKFKGKSPIGSNKPNFLNRKKQQQGEKNSMNLTSDTFNNSPRAIQKLPQHIHQPGKAITVKPLRQRILGEQQYQNNPNQSPHELQPKVQVAFATTSGKLIGRAGIELLALGQPFETISHAAYNPTNRDAQPAFVMISSPQMQMFDASGRIMAAYNHHIEHGAQQNYPTETTPMLRHETEISSPDLMPSFGQQNNYTTQLKNNDEKLSDKKSPSPISIESSPEMRMIEKDRLTAARLEGSGANTNMSHHLKPDQSAITPQQQQQYSEKMLRSGFGSPDFKAEGNKEEEEIDGPPTPLGKQLNQPSVMGSGDEKTSSV